jgi:hypothetical protein
MPDTGTVVADYEEGCQLTLTATTITGYPVEEVIRGRLGTIKFVKGGFQVFRDDPARGATFSSRLEQPPTPTETVAVESPRNETEALWENFLECVRARRQSTFSPPDLGAAAVATAAMATQSYRTGQALFWDRDRRETAPADSTWAARWEQRSKSRGKPNQIFGWSGDESASAVQAPPHQKLAGPWMNGKDPGV